MKLTFTQRLPVIAPKLVTPQDWADFNRILDMQIEALTGKGI